MCTYYWTTRNRFMACWWLGYMPEDAVVSDLQRLTLADTDVANDIQQAFRRVNNIYSEMHVQSEAGWGSSQVQAAPRMLEDLNLAENRVVQSVAELSNIEMTPLLRNLPLGGYDLESAFHGPAAETFMLSESSANPEFLIAAGRGVGIAIEDTGAFAEEAIAVDMAVPGAVEFRMVNYEPVVNEVIGEMWEAAGIDVAGIAAEEGIAVGGALMGASLATTGVFGVSLAVTGIAMGAFLGTIISSHGDRDTPQSRAYFAADRIHHDYIRGAWGRAHEAWRIWKASVAMRRAMTGHGYWFMHRHSGLWRYGHCHFYDIRRCLWDAAEERDWLWIQERIVHPPVPRIYPPAGVVWAPTTFPPMGEHWDLTLQGTPSGEYSVYNKDRLHRGPMTTAMRQWNARVLSNLRARLLQSLNNQVLQEVNHQLGLAIANHNSDNNRTSDQMSGSTGGRSTNIVGRQVRITTSGHQGLVVGHSDLTLPGPVHWNVVGPQLPERHAIFLRAQFTVLSVDPNRRNVTANGHWDRAWVSRTGTTPLGAGATITSNPFSGRVQDTSMTVAGLTPIIVGMMRRGLSDAQIDAELRQRGPYVPTTIVSAKAAAHTLVAGSMVQAIEPGSGTQNGSPQTGGSQNGSGGANAGGVTRTDHNLTFGEFMQMTGRNINGTTAQVNEGVIAYGHMMNAMNEAGSGAPDVVVPPPVQAAVVVPPVQAVVVPAVPPVVVPHVFPPGSTQRPVATHGNWTVPHWVTEGAHAPGVRSRRRLVGSDTSEPAPPIPPAPAPPNRGAAMQVAPMSAADRVEAEVAIQTKFRELSRVQMSIMEFAAYYIVTDGMVERNDIPNYDSRAILIKCFGVKDGRDNAFFEFIEDSKERIYESRDPNKEYRGPWTTDETKLLFATVFSEHNLSEKWIADRHERWQTYRESLAEPIIGCKAQWANFKANWYRKAKRVDEIGARWTGILDEYNEAFDLQWKWNPDDIVQNPPWGDRQRLRLLIQLPCVFPAILTSITRAFALTQDKGMLYQKDDVLLQIQALAASLPPTVGEIEMEPQVMQVIAPEEYYREARQLHQQVSQQSEDLPDNPALTAQTSTMFALHEPTERVQAQMDVIQNGEHTDLLHAERKLMEMPDRNGSLVPIEDMDLRVPEGSSVQLSGPVGVVIDSEAFPDLAMDERVPQANAVVLEPKAPFPLALHNKRQEDTAHRDPSKGLAPPGTLANRMRSETVTNAIRASYEERSPSPVRGSGPGPDRVSAYPIMNCVLAAIAAYTSFVLLTQKRSSNLAS